MKKPNLSKESISRFFLYHSEKLILGISIVLLGTFFYMGFGSEPGVDSTPAKLKQTSDQATQYINKPNAWERIGPLRQSEPLLATLPDAAPKEDTRKYLFGPFSVKCPTMEARTDPNLHPPTELVARAIAAPVLLSPPRGVELKNDPISRLPLAASSMGNGFDRNFASDFDLGDDFEEGLGRQSGRRPRTPKSDEDAPPEIDAGDRLLPIHTLNMLGVRPTRYNFRPETEKSFVMNVVVVAGLVNIEQQSAEYEKSFASSVGFYPYRDRPEYQYFQVERREVVDGQPTEWADITDAITLKQPAFHPQSMETMPRGMFTSAPEYVAPDFYDPLLTSPIPPISRVDYRPFVTHPKIENRKFDDLFGADADQPGARVRPNFDQFGNNSGVRPGMEGRPGMRGPQGIRGMRRGSGQGDFMDDEELPPVRAGSDSTKYEMALMAEEPASQYKLFRFFDLAAKPGKTYQYRIRLWLNDPNHEPSEAELKKLSDLGIAADGGGRPGMDMEAGMRRSRRGREFVSHRPGAEGDFEEGLGGEDREIFQKIPITNKMKAITVRNRLQQSRSLPNPKNRRLSDFYVTETYTDDEGNEVKDEILVPKSKPYLQFSRPTPWSDVIEVSGIAPSVDVLAGDIFYPKPTRVANKELPDGEPVAAVVPVVWSRKYGTELPVRKMARRADVLNYVANIHILNSVTWEVHVFDNAPVVSKSVVVDIMGGEELPLPKEEQMRHNLPSEILVMNADGSFHVSNDMQDKGRVKRTLFLEDESATVGGEKAAKRRQKQLEEQRGVEFGFPDRP